MYVNVRECVYECVLCMCDCVYVYEYVECAYECVCLYVCGCTHAQKIAGVSSLLPSRSKLRLSGLVAHA